MAGQGNLAGQGPRAAWPRRQTYASMPEGPPEDGEASSDDHNIDWDDGITPYDEGTELEYDYEDGPELDELGEFDGEALESYAAMAQHRRRFPKGRGKGRTKGRGGKEPHSRARCALWADHSWSGQC